MRVGLVDDHLLFLDALVSLVSADSEVEVVGGARDARSAYRLVQEKQPDVLVLDLALDGVSGLTVAREVRRMDLPGGKPPKVLMLSMYSDEEHAAEGLAAGATGYACKQQSGAELIQAIKAVGGGRTYLAPSLDKAVVEEKLRVHQRRGGPDAVALLSPREREIFDLLVRGFSNDAIGAQLFISPKTVETHRSHIMTKLRLHSIAEMVRYAAQHGLLHV
jgi:two-component system response regulator NreC